MTHAKFHFNRSMLTLIFGIRASEPPPSPPPRTWRTTEKAGPDRVKSGTLPLTLHKFIRIVSFSKRRPDEPNQFRPRKPSLNHFENQNLNMKFQNCPASFSNLFSSYSAQSSYLVQNITITSKQGFTVNVFSSGYPVLTILRSQSFWFL